MNVRTKILRAQQRAARKRNPIQQPDTVRIVVLAGKTFRGVHHFEETKYDASTGLTAYAIREGVARLIEKP
jgi:hypothetical protein